MKKAPLFVDVRDAVSHFSTFKNSSYAAGLNINPKLHKAVDLYLKLEETGPIKYIDLQLYNYRDNPLGISRGDQNGVNTAKFDLIATTKALKRRNITGNKAKEIIRVQKSKINFFEGHVLFRNRKILSLYYLFISLLYSSKQFKEMLLPILKKRQLALITTPVDFFSTSKNVFFPVD